MTTLSSAKTKLTASLLLVVLLLAVSFLSNRKTATPGSGSLRGYRRGLQFPFPDIIMTGGGSASFSGSGDFTSTGTSTSSSFVSFNNSSPGMSVSMTVSSSSSDVVNATNATFFFDDLSALEDTNTTDGEIDLDRVPENGIIEVNGDADNVEVTVTPIESTSPQDDESEPAPNAEPLPDEAAEIFGVDFDRVSSATKVDDSAGAAEDEGEAEDDTDGILERFPLTVVIKKNAGN